MKRFFLILFCLIISLESFSHPWKPRHYVIIDTDGGIDDIKAITMLLASPDVRVLAITVSPGSLSKETAYKKVKSLLNSFYHEGIPVGINRSSKFKSPEFPVALNAVWGKENELNEKNAPDHISLISDILSAEKTKISFICLGTMSSAASAIKEIPAYSKQVKQIIWSVSASDEKAGFNYKSDVSAAEAVLKSGFNVKMVRGLETEPFYTESLLKKISVVQSVYSEKISAFFSNGTVKNHSFSFVGFDEMIPLYLHYPGLFSIDSEPKTTEIFTPRNVDSLRIITGIILSGATVERNQVVKEFPVEPSFYFDDIEPSVNEIIGKYGRDEWASGVIANELHRHLGVFAIVGVKMGIRAREYFNTGVDEFSAVSFAGSMPPLSCMNDGIQVSTGATPGHGLLTVRNDVQATPSVEFTYMNRKIRLTLKPEISEKISSELKEINFIHGLDSDIYWELVRKNSIKYWRDLDRHEIFNIEAIH
jgi:pyrimidine-specific ribonucleoside hydrolase